MQTFLHVAVQPGGNPWRGRHMSVETSGFFSSKIAPLYLAAALVLVPGPLCAEALNIGIGTQNTTTNTVTGGVVLKELGLLEKYLPKTGKYKDFTYTFEW